MSTYQVYYPAGCIGEIPEHYCNACDELEHGRIRSAAFISQDFEFSDPENPLEWISGIAQKKIIIIPEVNGTFDGGAEVESPGYGDQVTKITGYNFSATFNDPNYKQNAGFYNAILRSRNWKFAFKTETQVHITDETVSVIPKNPVTDDPNSEVVWAVTVKWASGQLPVPYDAPANVFVCLDYTGIITA